MKRFFLVTALSILAITMVVVPIQSMQAGGTLCNNPPCDGEFTNPLGEGTTVSKIVVRIINFLLGLSGMIAMLVLIWGGIKFTTAAGNEERVRDAKATILWAVIGIIVVLTSFAIIQTVLALLRGGQGGIGL